MNTIRNMILAISSHGHMWIVRKFNGDNNHAPLKNIDMKSTMFISIIDFVDQENKMNGTG